jgi:hypothetical protein
MASFLRKEQLETHTRVERAFQQPFRRLDLLEFVSKSVSTTI